MRFIQKYSKYIPYLYFLTVVAYWFTIVNRNEGISAFPILLFGIPFLWQLIKPNEKLNFTLGISFVCLSSYLLIAYTLHNLNVIEINERVRHYALLGSAFVMGNLLMSLWMVNNSLKKVY